MDDQHEHFQYTVVKHIARQYGVKRENVTPIGEVDDEASWFVVCKECRLRELHAPIFMEETVGLEPLTQVNFVVRLLPKLRGVNHIYTLGFKYYVVLSGQCEDCGHVYCAWSPLKTGMRTF